MRRISRDALSLYNRTLQTLGIYPEQKTLLRTPLTPVIICFPSYLREGDTGQLKHARPYFQIVFENFTNFKFKKKNLVPELRDVLLYLFMSILVDCAIISVFRAALYCLTCIIHVFYMDLITYSGLCVCGYNIVAPLCRIVAPLWVVSEISLYSDAMTIKTWIELVFWDFLYLWLFQCIRSKVSQITPHLP